jgi:hypothetical protein
MTRRAQIKSTYRVDIPGILLPRNGDERQDTWHSFVIDADELLELYAAIKQQLALP